jgi:hypothetical protein
LGPASQADLGGLDSSQGGLGLGGFGSLGSMLTQASGGFSQIKGGSSTLGGGGLGLGGLGDLSQASFTYAPGGEDLAGAGAHDGMLTQGTGLSQGGFGGLLGGMDAGSSLFQEQQGKMGS